MDQLREVKSKFLHILRFPVYFLGVVRICYDESVPHALVRLANEKSFAELAIEEISTLLLESTFTGSAIFWELASIDGVLDSFYSKPRFLSIFELPIVANSPLIFGFIVVLDTPLTVKHSIGPLTLHDPVHFLLRLGMRNCIQSSLSVVSIRPPGSFVDRQNFIFGYCQHDPISSVSHGLDTVSEIIIAVVG